MLIYPKRKQKQKVHKMTYSSSNRSRLNNYQRSPEPARRRRFSWGKGLAALLIAAVIFAAFKVDLQIKAADHAAALAVQAHIKSQEASVEHTFNGVQSANPGLTFAVSLIDLNSGASQNLGSSSPMEAASVTKVLTACLYLHEVEMGQASLGQSIGGNSARYELQQLINQSDDTAWQLFNDQLGHSALLAYAQGLRLDSYDPSTNAISASDMARLLDKLYTGSLLNPKDTQLLLSWMQNTNYESFITPAVPAGDTIHHKVGLIDDNVNDAAIVTSGHKNLVLVIFTDGHGTMQWDVRAELMQQLASSAISSYFN